MCVCVCVCRGGGGGDGGGKLQGLEHSIIDLKQSLPVSECLCAHV